MIRALLLACCILIPALAAENLAARTVQARDQALAQLAQARTAIATERAALMAGLQEAHRTAALARERLIAATAARDDAVAALRKRTSEQEREIALIRSLAERAVVAGRLSQEQLKTLASSSANQRPIARVAAGAQGLALRLEQLDQRLRYRVEEESIIARDGRIVSAPVLRLGEARAIALGGDQATRGLLARATDGSSWLVQGRRLPPLDPKALTSLPFDPTGTGGGEAHHGRSLREWIIGGRVFIWPILAVFAAGLLISLWRFLTLHRLAVEPRLTLQVAELLTAGRGGEAETLVAARRTPLERVLAVGVAVRHRPRAVREAALDQVLIGEHPRLYQGLAFILVLAGIAPLLGLLGTVTGMIDMFGVIAQQGSGNAKTLSGAISEALITTQAGMIAAIPLLLLHAILSRIAERRLLRLEEASAGVLGIEAGLETGLKAGTATVAEAP